MIGFEPSGLERAPARDALCTPEDRQAPAQRALHVAAQRRARPPRRASSATCTARATSCTPRCAASPIGDGESAYLVVQVRRHLRPQALRGPAAAARGPRRAHRPVQPPALQRRARVDRRLRAPLRPSRCAAGARRRPLLSYINDSYGHATGDELLGTVAALLRSRLRETDIVGRLGGDEFGVILPQTTLEDAESIAPGAGRGDARAGPDVARGRKVRATLSIGHPRDRARRRLTPASSWPRPRSPATRRRSAAATVSPSPAATAAASAALRAPLTGSERLREALERDGFVLYEQPILRPRATSGVERSELLIRMLGDAGEPIAARRASSGAAERYGLIKAIDRWVIGARDPPARRAPARPATSGSGSTSTSQASRSPTRR